MASDISMKSPARDRPLSPHLQIYRWQWTMSLSILHRMTGVALAVGTVVLVWWLVAAAVSPAYFGFVERLLSHWIGRLLLFGWSVSLFYHLCNGIRHLFWDTGRGFALGTARASGTIVLLATAALTAVAWLAGYGLI